MQSVVSNANQTSQSIPVYNVHAFKSRIGRKLNQTSSIVGISLKLKNNAALTLPPKTGWSLLSSSNHQEVGGAYSAHPIPNGWLSRPGKKWHAGVVFVVLFLPCHSFGFARKFLSYQGWFGSPRGPVLPKIFDHHVAGSTHSPLILNYNYKSCSCFDLGLTGKGGGWQVCTHFILNF